MIPRDLKKKVRLLENGSGHYSVQSVPKELLLLLLLLLLLFIFYYYYYYNKIVHVVQQNSKKIKKIKTTNRA